MTYATKTPNRSMRRDSYEVSSDSRRTEVLRSYFERSKGEENPELRENPFLRRDYKDMGYRRVVQVSRDVGENGGYRIAKPFSVGYGHAEGGSCLSGSSMTMSQFGASLTASFLGKN